MIRLRVLITGFIIISCLFAFSCDKKQPETDSTVKEPANDSLVIELTGQNGKSVLEITGESHTLETDESGMGVFVRAIDSVFSGDEYWWVYTVNDSIANKACDKYITNDSDQVKWIYKKP
jgi:uncharacterized protein DUF4430